MVATILFVIGLAMGSFVNALVWRIHEQSKPKKKRAASGRELSITKGRSMCPECHHTLSWDDLLPVVSWLSLRGKCRYCHQAISWQYPAVELITSGLFVFSYVFWPLSLSFMPDVLLFGMWLVFIVAFVALSVYDLRWMILPNRIVFPLQALAVVYLLIRLATAGPEAWSLLIAALLSLLVSAGLFYVIFQVSEGKWIGGGDVKLAVILALLLGDPARALLMLFIASSLGSIVGVPLLLLGKAKQNTKLPFGPFLIMATFVVHLFGAVMVSWYRDQALYI